MRKTILTMLAAIATVLGLLAVAAPGNCTVDRAILVLGKFPAGN